MTPIEPARSADGTGLAGGIGRRLAMALPDARTCLAGSLAWAAAMGVTAAAEMVRMQWYAPERIAVIALFFAAGGLLAFVPAVFLGRLLSRGRRDAGFAATLLALGVGTVAMTGFLVGLQYRSYYAAWHQEAFSVVWVFQFVFTVGSAVYQFLVLGARIYVPVGLLFLVLAAAWNVRAVR